MLEKELCTSIERSSKRFQNKKKLKITEDLKKVDMKKKSHTQRGGGGGEESTKCTQSEHIKSQK